ncbi:MAG: hypothetical protein LBG60_16795 [Bifidobacteriaceae bacterium]|jgi:hypothetical protein|nr:hypothetical protein [Bifidobacteriaceae bacterium]
MAQRILTRQVGDAFEPIEAPDVLTTVGWPVTFAAETYPDDAQWLIDHGHYLPEAATADGETWGCKWRLQDGATDHHHNRLTAHAVAAIWREADLQTKFESTKTLLRDQQLYAEARGLPAVADPAGNPGPKLEADPDQAGRGSASGSEQTGEHVSSGSEQT